MLKDERYDKILEILEDETYTSAANLSKRLFVSLPTIRRDLAELQRRNLILRSHGGAKKINSEHTVLPIDFRKSQNIEAKKRICAYAAGLIKDNDIVFIDASSTAVHIADFIPSKKSITVITNSIPLSVALKKKEIKTYCTGGEIQENSLGFAGTYAEELIKNFNLNIMFFSSYGINSNNNIVDTSMPETILRKSVAQQSDKLVFLCDSSKFQRSAPYNLMPLSETDLIITDTNLNINLAEYEIAKKIILV